MSELATIKLYSLSEASIHLHLTAEYLRRLARLGKISSRKIRNRFFMTAEDITAVATGERSQDKQ